MSEQVVGGIHAVHALLNNPHRRILQVLVNEKRQDQRIDALISAANARQIECHLVPLHQLNLNYPELVHQGVVAIAAPMKDFHEKDMEYLLGHAKAAPFILVLDGVTDPHNLGACIRSADAAGVDWVIIPKDRSAKPNAVVAKVACGALEAVPVVQVTNLARTLQWLKANGVWIYGAAGEAQRSLYEMDLKAPVALVMGAEGSGMRRLTREQCDDLYALPMQGQVSSLNVSVAAGISLYEVVRQRQS